MKGRSVTRKRLSGRGLAALAVLLTLSGCTMRRDQPQQVTWDLTGSPTRADVGWSADRADDSTYHLDRHSSLTFHLPDGRSFHAEDVELFLEAPADRISSIQVHTEPMTTDAAVTYASGLTAEWDMQGPSLEDWAEASKRAHAEGRNLARTARQTDGPIANGGPIIDLRMLNSFGETEPVVVAVGFFWPNAPRVPTS